MTVQPLKPASQLTPAIQPQVQQPGGQPQQQSFGASPNGFVSNLNRVNPNAFGQQQQQQQFLSNQNHVYNTVQQLANGGMVGPGQLQGRYIVRAFLDFVMKLVLDQKLMFVRHS